MIGISSGTGRNPRGASRAGRPAARRATAQVVWAAALALLVLAGGLEIHPAGESHDPVSGLAGQQGETYFQGASHPVQPAHAERAVEAQRPFCAVCLNRLNGLGTRLEAPSELAQPVADQSLPPAVAVSPLARAMRPDGARAPPLA
jgi:hypothetical protein